MRRIKTRVITLASSEEDILLRAHRLAIGAPPLAAWLRWVVLQHAETLLRASTASREAAAKREEREAAREQREATRSLRVPAKDRRRAETLTVQAAAARRRATWSGMAEGYAESQLAEAEALEAEVARLLRRDTTGSAAPKAKST